VKVKQSEKSAASFDTGEDQRFRVDPTTRIRPIYIRLPAPGVQCPWTGLSRSALADLCVPNKANRFRPPVKSFAAKKRKDAKRHARLIVFESLVSYLRRFEEAA
jgi:hypothetical protein